MTDFQFGIFALVWPFLSIGLAVAGVLLVHRWFDRQEQRDRAAE